MEPLRNDIIARLAQTTAAHLRSRKADMPASIIVTTVIDLKTGCRKTTFEVVAPNEPVISWDTPADASPDAEAVCAQCRAPIEPPRRKFCSERCIAKFHSGGRNPLHLWEPGRSPEPVIVPAYSNEFLTPVNRCNVIQWIVCEVWGVPIEAMTSPRRSRVWAWPRMCAMDLCRKLVSGLSLPAVGHRFGHRDHTTVMHARDATEERLKSERDDFKLYAKYYHECEARCRSALNLPAAS